ncbi:MAG: heme lyase CcmF/NrfE family subunit, partial [Calditrichaeota bacterium]
TYTLCIFGTFITRSGVISSVHAFALSNIGPMFAGFLIFIILVSAYLVIKRLPLLKSDQHFESVISRESAFLINNLVFLGACFAVLWGTIFPIVSEAIRGVKVTVGAPFFNSVNVPIGLFLLFLTGVGPLVAWRKTSPRLLKKIFLRPTLISLLGLVIMLIAGMRHFYALVSFTLAIFVTATIVDEFHRGARARMKTNQESYPVALWHLLLKNKRRYGGYIVHFGIVVLFIGFTGQAFGTDSEAKLKFGESMNIRNYTLTYRDLRQLEDPNKIVWKAKMDVYKNGKKIDTIYPNKHFYKVQQQPTTEVVLHSTLLEDLYVVLVQPNEDNSALFKVYLNPLVNWVWIAGLIVTLGTFIILLPEEKGKAPSRKQIAKKRKVSKVMA